MNTQTLALMISRLQSREDFNMGTCETCLISDLCAVLNLGNPNDYSMDVLAYHAGLTNDEVWELFYATSIPSISTNSPYQPRSLSSYTKDEALRVLDALMQGEPVTGVWGRTVGLRNQRW